MKRALQGILPLAWLAGVGCYDWTVRASADADVDATTPKDDAGELDAPQVDGSDDAPPLDAGSCDSLAAALDEAFVDATKCILASGQCVARIKDECGCNRFVALPDSGATAAYVAAVAEYTTAGCKRKVCPPCLAQISTCLQNEAGATLCANF